MKTLDVEAFEQVAPDTQRALKEKSDQISDLQQAIDSFVNMEDAFKGKAGNAIRGYFRDFHQPFLLYLQSFLADYNEQLNQILKDLSYFEPDLKGYIEEAFIQNSVIPALKKLESAIGYLLEDANKAMREVSDLVELPKLDIDEKLHPIQKARKKANKTLEQLYDFDTKATRSLEALDQDIDTMIKFVRQMESMAGDGSFDIATYHPTEAYRSLEGGLIQKTGLKPVQTIDGKDFEGHLSVKFHRYEDGVIVMEYRKPGSKQPHYELVDEIPKQAIPGSENPDDPLLLDIWKGFYDGAGKAIGDTINGLLSLGKSALDRNTYSSIGKKAVDYGNKLKSSPIATLNSTAHKTIDMAKYMGQAVQNAFERDVIHGDAKSRTEFFTYGLTSIGISLIGDKGLSKLGTATKAVKAGKLAEKAEKLKVNTGFVPALEAAGTGKTKIPYNAMDELGIRIQKATKEKWAESTKAQPEKVINALSNFQSRKITFGNQQFILDKKGIKHILERHHPKYWNGSIKKSQTFLHKNLSLEDISSIVQGVMQQNRKILIERGTVGSYQISGTVNGIEYIIGIKNGRIGQLYPK
ncbi:LXG domain-containing protein [Heyndrickxia coagulans]|uniref:LXG domain-containing protein n=1 Tax=Heyndrickxia coagulans TaxID=1398 RepID=UPI00037FED13|nr:T7SS effector LXG polymorphic toxin [Heyndrickxia coagulans]